MLTLPARLVEELEPIRARLHAGGNAVLPVVGAGLSRGLLSWTKLLEQLIALVDRAEDRDALAVALAHGKHLEVAGDLEPMVHRARVGAAIERAYQRPKAPRPDVYERIAALPVTHFATTNYDPWLKDAVAARLGQAPRVYTPDDPGAFENLAPGSPPLVLMLHGDADRPGTCVLSEAGYRRLMHFPAYRQAMAALVAMRSLLFMGQSLTDPDLRLVLDEWQEVSGAGGAPRHWFLGVGLGTLEQRRLLERGVTPVEYGKAGDYTLLEPVLEYLATPPGGGGTSAISAAVASAASAPPAAVPAPSGASAASAPPLAAPAPKPKLMAGKTWKRWRPPALLAACLALSAAVVLVLARGLTRSCETLDAAHITIACMSAPRFLEKARAAPAEQKDRLVPVAAHLLWDEFQKVTRLVRHERRDFRESDYAAVEQICAFITTLDSPDNGYVLYYRGEVYWELKDRPSMRLYFNKYLTVAKNEGEADDCYATRRGYCRERTAWILSLLANDYYNQALDMTDPGARTSDLRTAHGCAAEVLKRWPGGFKAGDFKAGDTIRSTTDLEFLTREAAAPER
jgi:hypothetical protein